MPNGRLRTDASANVSPVATPDAYSNNFFTHAHAIWFAFAIAVDSSDKRTVDITDTPAVVIAVDSSDERTVSITDNPAVGIAVDSSDERTVSITDNPAVAGAESISVIYADANS